MSDTNKQCPKCKQLMEPGMRLDAGYGGIYRENWISKQIFDIKDGNYNTGFLIFKNPFKRSLAVITYRCTGCGYLGSYA